MIAFSALRFRLKRKTQNKRINFHKVCLRSPVDHLTRHRGWRGKVVRDIQDLVAQVARMGGAQFAVMFDIPFLQEICQPLVAVFDLFIIGHAAEDFAVLFIRRIADLDLVPKTAQEGLIHQIPGR